MKFASPLPSAAQRMATSLRVASIRAELYLGSGKFGPQMKYADRRGSPCVVIQGTDEKQKGEAQIKDLIVGAELAGLSKERDDCLKKQADAQFAVPEDRLVDAVREVLARHGMTWGDAGALASRPLFFCARPNDQRPSITSIPAV